MSVAAVHLEGLARELTRRRWAARAALVDGQGAVLFVSDSGSPEADPQGTPGAADDAAPPEVTARIYVERIDEAEWVHVEVGSVLLLARLAQSAYADPARAWLSTALRKLGVTVERDSLAQE